MEFIKKLIKKGFSIVWGFFTSSDMKALYWYSFAQFVAAAGDILIQNLTAWDPNNMLTIAAGLIFSRITKRLNT